MRHEFEFCHSETTSTVTLSPVLEISHLECEERHIWELLKKWFLAFRRGEITADNRFNSYRATRHHRDCGGVTSAVWACSPTGCGQLGTERVKSTIRQCVGKGYRWAQLCPLDRETGLQMGADGSRPPVGHLVTVTTACFSFPEPDDLALPFNFLTVFSMSFKSHRSARSQTGAMAIPKNCSWWLPL